MDPMTNGTRRTHLAKVIDRNIETLLEVRRQLDRGRTRQDYLADNITSFSGSMLFGYLHIAWFSLWIIINLGLTPLPAFDPYPFGLLTMIVSLEAIFLSTFVLISQNRMTRASDQRSDLDLQIDLLSEYEITKILKIIDAMAKDMKIDAGKDPEIDELKVEIAPDAVLREMEKRQREHGL